MTTQTPSAAHLPDAPASVRYRLSCAASGRARTFTACPTPLDIRVALTDLFLFGAPSDVTALALAEAVCLRPDEVARYGEVWELVQVSP